MPQPPLPKPGADLHAVSGPVYWVEHRGPDVFVYTEAEFVAHCRQLDAMHRARLAHKPCCSVCGRPMVAGQTGTHHECSTRVNT